MFRRARHYAAMPLALTLVLIGSGILSADSPQAKVPTPTDSDFTLQGEYTGEVHVPSGDQAIGVQVVALGDGKLKAVSYIGGLPGDGWDSSERTRADGTSKGAEAEFNAQGYSSKLKDGVLSISLLGVNIAELKKQQRTSRTDGAPPPAGAIVLFDGSSADKFENGKIDEEKLLVAGCTSKEKFGSGKLHVEFRVPFMPKAEGQARGNSGVYLQGRYEVQILDSFGLDESKNDCAAIYGVRAPDTNLCYPPMEWQTYEIDFTAPEYKDGKEVSPAVMSVKHNDQSVHRKAKVPQPTAGSPVTAGPDPGPIYLQDHGNPVRFRNIWFLPKAPAPPAN